MTTPIEPVGFPEARCPNCDNPMAHDDVAETDWACLNPDCWVPGPKVQETIIEE